MRLFATVLFFASMLIAGCSGCNDTPNQTGPVKVNKMEERIELNEKYVEPLKENLTKFFNTMSEGDFEGYVELVYPRVFITDSLKQQTIEMMQNYADQGFRNVTKEYELLYVSPLIQDTLQKVCRVVAKVKHEILFGPEYVGNPQDLEPMVRNQFGKDSFEFNETENKYEIDGIIKLYAITPDDQINFTFLNDQYSESRYLGDMLLYNTVIELKKIDADNGF